MIAERENLVARFVAARSHVLGFVTALTRSTDIAEEIVQELSLQVLKEAERGTAPDDPFAWFLGAARHRVVDYYRSRTQDEKNFRRLLTLADAVETAFVENPPLLSSDGGKDASEDPRVAHLRECLGKVSAKTRVMLDGRYGGKASIDCIARKMSWTAEAVKVALAKARRALGECVRRKLAAEVRRG